jgi:hypothetical protein
LASSPTLTTLDAPEYVPLIAAYDSITLLLLHFIVSKDIEHWKRNELNNSDKCLASYPTLTTLDAPEYVPLIAAYDSITLLLLHFIVSKDVGHWKRNELTNSDKCLASYPTLTTLDAPEYVPLIAAYESTTLLLYYFYIL